MKDGGPAFPSEVINEVLGNGARRDWKNYKGMSLRDYFAAKAMQGELASQNIDESWPERSDDHLAKRCYHVADAMLEERDK